MKTFAIVALKRHDLTESIVGLRKCEEEARRTARQNMAAMAELFVRCRVQPVDLSVADVKALCYGWGVEAALAGEPVTNELPGVYADEYRRGYESVGRPSGAAARSGPDSGGPNAERTRP